MIGLVVALFAAPSSNGAAQLGTLTVTPGSGSYGGQLVRFQGDMGTGEQRIHLQRRGNPTAAWADVVDPRTGKPFSTLTAANGEFDFRFPAPAMNYVYFRLHSRSSDTPAHLFTTTHQDAVVDLVQSTNADVPLPPGFAVVGEPYTIAVDTAGTQAGRPTKPVLADRAVHLEQRTESGEWKFVRSVPIGRDGRLDFGQVTPSVPAAPLVYRAVMQNWPGGGAPVQVGWFPSLPFHLNVVRRPAPVAGLKSVVTPISVALTWTLPPDPERQKVVIARTAGRDAPAPTAANIRNIITTPALPSTALTYVDLDVTENSTYKYAVYTVSEDGVYTALEQRLTALTPAKRGEG